MMRQLEYSYGLRVEARLIGMCLAHPVVPLHRGIPHTKGPISPLSASEAYPAMEHTYLGHANNGSPLWLTLEQRLRHIAVSGKTGYGKSTELKSVIAQDIARGDGLLLLDPTGTLAEEVLTLIPPSRHNHVCYFNIADRDFPIAFNVYADVPHERRSTLAELFVSAFKSIWFDMWGPQLERQLRASSLALLDTPGTSMVDILRLYLDPDFRAHILARCRNPIALIFFQREFSTWTQEFLDRAISPVL